MLSRGCPYNCYYCCNRALSSVYPSSTGYYRLPSVEYSIKLLEKMLGQYPEITFFDFEDDLLIANKVWFLSFADEYQKRINLPFRICARIECIDKDIVKALRNCGCEKVFVGLESGNEYIRNTVLNKNFSNSSLLEKCAMIKTAGLELYTFNIVGLPFEREKEMKDTYDLNLSVSPDFGVCTFFYPYKSTELYNICRENNLLKSTEEMLEITNYNTRPGIKMPPELEKICYYYQKKISRYLNRNTVRRVMKIKTANLPAGLRKFSGPLNYLAGLKLCQYPLFYVAFKHIYHFFGIKALFRNFSEESKKR